MREMYAVQMGRCLLFPPCSLSTLNPLRNLPQAVEIRELILRCLSQMVLARVNNVKSGWKSM